MSGATITQTSCGGGDPTTTTTTTTTTAAPTTTTTTTTATPTLDVYYNNVELLLHLNGSTSDSSKNNRTATDVSGFTASNTSRWGSGSYFNNGSIAHIGYSSFQALGTGDFVLEAWIYPTGGGAIYQPLFDTRNRSSGSEGNNFGVQSNNWRLFADGAPNAFGSGGPDITPDQWNYVVFAKSSGILRAYINGIQHGQGINSSVNHSSSQMVIGGNAYMPYGVEPFRGYIDEVRITVGSDRGFIGSTINLPSEAFPQG